ncbi:hypothetical protein ACLOJK_021019 [Asimina triloba]
MGKNLTCLESKEVQLPRLVEQSLLVWQFICSVPIMLLEDFLPWMMSHLSVDEQTDILHSIDKIVPEEKLLREVVSSWLGKKSLPSHQAYSAGLNDKVASPLNGEFCLEFPKLYSSRKQFTCSKKKSNINPIDGVRLWHGALRKEMKDIAEELHEIRNLKIYSSLSSVSCRIMFVIDVLIFYSDALEKVIFPLLNGESDGYASFLHRQFPKENQIKGLFSVLQDFNAQNGRSLSELVDDLCWQLEYFIVQTTEHFEFQESEVFLPILKNCDHEKQRSMLYSSFLVMPLGLLKFLVTWLSTHLTEEESKEICYSIRLAGSEVDMPFAPLLHEWFRIGYSGKTSLEKFRKDLQEMFKTRSSFVAAQFEGAVSSSVDAKTCKRPHPATAEKKTTDNTKGIKNPNQKSFDMWLQASDCSSFKSQKIEKCSTADSCGTNFYIFFSDSLKKISHVSDKANAGSSAFQGAKPIDHIFHFHKVLEKDLDYLVHESAKMVENFEVFLEFRPRFHLVKVLYQAHSNAEDEIAFPALEAKGTLQNISGSYIIDHKLEEEHFRNISSILDEISELYSCHSTGESSIMAMASMDSMQRCRELCVKLHGMCKAMQVTLGQHVYREEIELWPLFLEHFSEEEQERIIGSILGRTRTEILQKMIPWLMESLTPDEQHSMMASWRKATKNTMFDEWLGEWWECSKRNDATASVKGQNILSSGAEDSLEVVAAYLSKEGFNAWPRESVHDEGSKFLEGNVFDSETENPGDDDERVMVLGRNRDNIQFSEWEKFKSESNEKNKEATLDALNRIEKPLRLSLMTMKFKHHEEHLLSLSQEDLEAAVRKASNDPTLDPQRNRWIITQQKLSHVEEDTSQNNGDIPGRIVSYRDPLKVTFGCKHYKRNCKLLAACCNRLFTCQYCHDDASDHSMDSLFVTLSQWRSTSVVSVTYSRMKGTSITALSATSADLARDLCPICHEDIFTSRNPVKALSCGHLMHSTCFQDYTCTHYTCPICSKSLGDMQVYFRMLDALLAEEEVPDEYSGKTQNILCNDCEKRGEASFHWLYHKCPHCNSYNTRLL